MQKLTVRVGVVVAERYCDRWIEDILDWLLRRRVLTFVSIDCTIASQPTSIDCPLFIRRYFNWDAARNAHCLPSARFRCYRDWLTRVADPDLVVIDNEQIRGQLPECDIVLDLSGHETYWADISRLVWRLEPCPLQSLTARMTLFESMIGDLTVASVRLISVTDGVQAQVDQRTIRLDRNSPSRSVANLGNAALGLIVDNIVRVQHGAAPRSLPAQPDGVICSAKVTSIQAARFLSQRLIATRRQRNDRLQWSVATIAPTLDAASARWYTPPLNVDIADPFPVWADGQLYVFVELFDLNVGRGQIAVFSDVTRRGWSDPEVVLEQPFHLSFPLVFTHQGEWFMLPEQSESGGVSLYRATRFPREWSLEREILVGFPGLDTMILQHEGRWWLFSTNRSGSNVDNNLHVFHSPSFDGVFEPLGGNPVKACLGSSRMAGHFFKHNGQLVRPAQNGLRTYGGGVVLNRVDHLSRDDYRETEIDQLAPFVTPYLEGFHTINRAGAVTLIDGVRRLPGQGARWV